VTHIRYSEREVRCLLAQFRLGRVARGFRRWVQLRWWLLLSFERVTRHVRTCTARQYRMAQRRQARTARLATVRSLAKSDALFAVNLLWRLANAASAESCLASVSVPS